mgnify:CR=1 FL=1
MSALFSRALFPFLLFCATALPLHAEDWRTLAPGLELREFLIPDQYGDLAGQQGGMAVLRIDPDRYDLDRDTGIALDHSSGCAGSAVSVI